MAEHRDEYFPSIQGLEDKEYLQAAFLLAKKGLDFQEGGGFVRGSDAKLVDLETVAGFGSLVIFDGRISHGVLDVDRGTEFSFDLPTGRFAAFSNLYKYLGK